MKLFQTYYVLYVPCWCAYRLWLLNHAFSDNKFISHKSLSNLLKDITIYANHTWWRFRNLVTNYQELWYRFFMFLKASLTTVNACICFYAWNQDYCNAMLNFVFQTTKNRLYEPMLNMLIIGGENIAKPLTVRIPAQIVWKIEIKDINISSYVRGYL